MQGMSKKARRVQASIDAFALHPSPNCDAGNLPHSLQFCDPLAALHAIAEPPLTCFSFYEQHYSAIRCMRLPSCLGGLRTWAKTDLDFTGHHPSRSSCPPSSRPPAACSGRLRPWSAPAASISIPAAVAVTHSNLCANSPSPARGLDDGA